MRNPHFRLATMPSRSRLVEGIERRLDFLADQIIEPTHSLIVQADDLAVQDGISAGSLASSALSESNLMGLMLRDIIFDWPL